MGVKSEVTEYMRQAKTERCPAIFNWRGSAFNICDRSQC
jgi:hypothetical protein